MLNNINTIKKDRGFTIVELLIVIVVIAVLAAITIVAYNGITARANAAKAQTNAAAVQKVAEAMNADNGFYPRAVADFTTGSTTTKLPSGVTVVGAAPTWSSTNMLTTIRYEYCGDAANPAAGAVKGGRITYYDGSAQQYLYVGTGVVTPAATAPCHTYNNAA